MQPVRPKSEASYQFDAFELDPVRRVLLKEGKAIALKPKVFETLLVLVRNSGRVMDKNELMQQVWPDTIVEEVNLAHNVSVLRKALGQKSEENRFIITVPGRGYGFVAEVTETQRNSPGSTAVTEYELTRSRLVIKEETDDKDLPNAFQLNAAGEDTRLLPGKQPKVNVALPRERKRFVFAATLVGLVMVIGVGLLIYSSRPAAPPPFAQIKSIAVLPFKPLIAESRDESLEMGMADTLIARLSNIRDMNVRPVSAVRKYSGMEQDAVAAGREQRVDAVLDGQIQKSGDKIRVTVRMVRVADGVLLWSSHFDETTTDIFRVQDSISERVVGVLELKLSSEERARLTNRDTENTDAYQLYMIGRFHYARRTRDAISRSIAYYEQAIEKDPRYALAYAALAASYSTSGWYGFLPSQQAYTKAKEAATKALEIDSTVAEAHAVLGIVKRSYDWDWAGSESEYKRAIELDPNYATAYHWYGDSLAYAGRFDESLASFKRAQEIDPVSLIINSSIGDTLLLARRYDQAIEQYQRVLQMDPSFADAHSHLGGAWLHKKNYPEAMSELLKGAAASGRSSQDVAALRTAYEASGMRGFWQQLIELKKRPSEGYVSPYDMAVLYVAVGEPNQAFEWLEKAYRERDPAMIMIKVEPVFDDMRSDPRFTDLLRRVGLSQ